MGKTVRILGRVEGTEIAEVALVLPLVFTFLLAIVWFGRALNIYSTIQHAAQQGAITAARPTCATCSPGNTFPAPAAVDTAVSAVMQASSIDPRQIVDPGVPTASCTTSPLYKITLCQQVLLNSTTPAILPSTCGSTPTPSQICGTLVTFQYPFTFYLPFTSLNLRTVTLKAQAQSRTEN